MAPTGHAARCISHDWELSPTHHQYFRCLEGGDGQRKFMWAHGYKPVNDRTPEYGAIYICPPRCDIYYERIDPPGASATQDSFTSESAAKEPPYHFEGQARLKEAVYDTKLTVFPIGWEAEPLRMAERHLQPLRSYPLQEIAAKATYAQPDRLWRPPSAFYVKGYCDHLRCRDPYCIEVQYQKLGFRDDLRHHEDDDKNGNMSDGDNAGGHSAVHGSRIGSHDSNVYPAIQDHVGWSRPNQLHAVFATDTPVA
ncbi:hypothetical protein BKA63DRAFT_205094 [Paraphoma chrysanthemicola]|nr:hypothetical protein BKA63DRAFT_205094 [Paraphoma chrysanthemicola]